MHIGLVHYKDVSLHTDPTLPSCKNNPFICSPRPIPSHTFVLTCSRLANSKLAFQPYSSEQLEEIVRSRLKGIEDVVRPLTIGIVARKVCHERLMTDLNPHRVF